MFARKYRPKDFSEVIGQPAVVSSLEKALKNNRVYHAYLFSGPRGVGKTSMARILAKSLNCSNSEHPTVKPCGKCTNCTEISKGKSLDLIEIDGASNRGIDEIRKLRENVSFSPSNSRFKIYIIDEVHQITHDAFNALLKTLEEPPSHVKFIFATTNPNKVPVTILSRCQRLKFGLLPDDKIVEKLKYIAKCEGIEVQDRVLNYIAKSSFGSIRDAESIFDQIVPLITEKVDFQNILDLLGQSPEYRISDFVDSLLEKDAKAALGAVDEVIKEGQDLNVFLTTVIEYLRNTMFAKLGEQFFSKVTSLPPDLAKRFLDFSKKGNMNYLLAIVDSLIRTKRLSRFLPSLRIPLEVEIIRLTYKEKEFKPKQKQQSPAAKDIKSGGFKHRTGSLNLESVSKVFKTFKKQKQESQKESEKKPEKKNVKSQNKEPEENSEVSLQKIQEHWEAIVNNISEKKMAVATYLREAELSEIKGASLFVGFPKNLSFHKEFLDTAEYRQLLEEKISNITGAKVRVIYILLEQEKKIDNTKQADSNIVNKVKKEFDGEIIT